MKIILSLMTLMVFTTQVNAQQSDPATLQKVINVLQQQRNSANDQMVNSMVTIQKLTEENKTLSDRVIDLQKQVDAGKGNSIGEIKNNQGIISQDGKQ